ncbi:MAG: DUF5320 domain-containing protein [Candidatus Aenigmarchaeota archaeon]|nr:DUF5320 domain-containing protein [Candidatus Aenigmarchaeota archaeon]
MPALDRTGPMGLGPGTGWGMGICYSPYGVWPGMGYRYSGRRPGRRMRRWSIPFAFGQYGIYEQPEAPETREEARAYAAEEIQQAERIIEELSEYIREMKEYLSQTREEQNERKA